MGNYDNKHYNFPTIDIGGNFYWTDQIKNDSLVVDPFPAGTTAELIVRQYPGGPILQDLSPFITVTLANATITIEMGADETADITWSKGSYKLRLIHSSESADVLLWGEIEAK